MNRKNLTAAVLAGLAGAAGLAGTAQAVILNPDGLGQILFYPYYTSNDGNQTVLSVVNTTENAKAVKVRFLEGYNSREVLDFNLYLSAYDVWVAAIADSEFFGAAAGVPHIYIPDNSCTVPYLYESASTAPGLQAFLSLAYSGAFNDGGPEGIERAAEGHFEMIEMGTLVGDSADYATHQLTAAVKDKDGNVTRPATWEPLDCAELVDQWTEYFGAPDGIWFEEAASDEENCRLDPEDPVLVGCQAWTDTTRNSGGLFGGAAVINPNNGTMFSYDAKAIQGFDKTDDGIHYLPGSIHPSLDDGSEQTAYVFFGVPQDRAVEIWYPRPIDAVSAVFMHEYIMNEYASDADLNAATEWVVNFPTKHYYVDELLVGDSNDIAASTWIPVGGDACANWEAGDPFPTTKGEFGSTIDGPGPWDNIAYGWDWGECYYTLFDFYVDSGEAALPFTNLFDGEACEVVELRTWDRDERTFEPDEPGGSRPPVVSPSLPGGCDPELQVCEFTPFQLCFETNVLRFGDESVFGTPEIEGSSLLVTIDNEFENGWGQINFGVDERHVDFAGLVGLPVVGFAAYEIQNGYVTDDDGATVKAYYGGLFGHKANVRRTCAEQRACGSFGPRAEAN
ncbi:MAG: hypothetical protein EHM68_11115 [Lysobacterales bacterium]|nr:MAG: hypothetical protein EHM68_11115 [Xanthomonadales bacterium]